MVDKTKAQLKQELAKAHQRIVELEQKEKTTPTSGEPESLSEVLDQEQRMLQTARTKEVAIFRALAENATDAILIGSLDSTITYANRATYELFGYDHEQQELLEAPISDLTPPKEKDFWVEEVLPTVEETGSWQGESKRQRKDGTIFEAYVTTFTIQDEAEQPSALAAIIRDIAEQKQAETEREHLHRELIDAQRRAIQELSTPVIPVMERIIVLPLVGSIDSMRARDITRSLLAGISAHRAKVVILDVTGVSIMDTGIVNHLNKTIQAARLKGARTIVTGVSDAVAESIVDLGIDWREITTLSNLQIGLVTALNSIGVKLSKS